MEFGKNTGAFDSRSRFNVDKPSDVDPEVSLAKFGGGGGKPLVNEGSSSSKFPTMVVDRRVSDFTRQVVADEQNVKEKKAKTTREIEQRTQG